MNKLSIAGSVLFALCGGLNIARGFIRLALLDVLGAIKLVGIGAIFIAIAIAIIDVVSENKKIIEA